MQRLAVQDDYEAACGVKHVRNMLAVAEDMCTWPALVQTCRAADCSKAAVWYAKYSQLPFVGYNAVALGSSRVQ